MARSKIRSESDNMKYSMGRPSSSAAGAGTVDSIRVDILIPDESDRASGEARQPRQGHRTMTAHLVFEQRQGIGRRLDHLGGLPWAADFSGDRTAGENFAGSTADEAIARKGFAAFDRLQQVGRTRVLEFGVSRDRRFEIRHQIRVDWDHIAFAGQGKKRATIGNDVHERKRERARGRVQTA